ncbi:transcription initiation factor IIB [Brachypodium distachyon]|uniref:transcription initiation factor IIB n=1 Tax=Brachypodium distachyon TaxID=15368 RepID=UPI0001C71AA6|nr:transcription initiation factor IIB [Brachypodium distachyon]|eukprot:XP_010233140.1 transcription initiation factor IIB [Brachypodium distachyon]
MARVVDVELRLGQGPRDRALVEGFEAISAMADRVGIVSAFRERAKVVFRETEEAKACGRRSRAYRSRGTVYAACLAIACRNEGPGSANTLKELAAATGHPAGAGAAMREIRRLTGRIRQRLGEEGAAGGNIKAAGVGAVRASTYVRRFGPLLEMGDRELAVAEEAARRLEESDLDVRHNGQSVAAGIVYLAANAAPRRPGRVAVSYEDVNAATRVSTSTLFLVCKKLRPHAQMLLG